MRALGLSHFSFLDHKPAELVRLARQSGFSFVSLRFHPFASGAVHYCPQSSAEIRELRRVMDGEGVGLYDVETIVIDHAFSVDALAPVIDAAAALGAERLDVCAEDWDRGMVVSRFARLCREAHRAGLGVDLEHMAWRGIDTPQKCLELIAESGADNAAVLVDALHLARSGNTAADVAAIAPRLVRNVQLCDAPAEGPASLRAAVAEARGRRLVPGDGGLDLAGLVAALPDHATLSAKVPMDHDARPPPDRAAAIYAATAALLERMQ